MALGGAAPDLRPYVPRLVLDWARDAPDARYRRIDGTMAFCDISGFTAMSERLAKKGRIGAEELTDVLNAVFAALLERAAEYDGTMLKYGGDAVLVFFTGDGHERRAAAATAAMRKTLRTVGRQRTSAGWVRLRMSVGLHSGEFDFFLVGSTHRELIVAGRAATLTCAMEAAANAGEILMSSTTANALAPSQLGERLGDAVALARSPRVSPVERSGERGSDGDAAAFVPTALRDYLLAGGESPEHRLVTTAFIAFGGLDEALATRGGDATAEALQSLIEIVSAQFEHHGVTFLATDIYGDGGKIIAVAGAPTGYENNEERMLRALRAIVDEYDGLPLHVGVHRGAVFTGDVGPAFRRTYTMLGDAVNTAARVMANAAVGEILATPSVLDRSQTLFDIAEREPFMAKGKAEPIATFAVGAVTGRRPSVGERLPLIGREAELGALRELLDDVRRGEGTVVELVGEAGIGKTRLVEEFVETAGVQTLVARCEQYQSSTPYFGLRQLLRGALGDPGDLRAAIAKVAPRVLPWVPLLAAVLGADMPSTPQVDQLAPAAFTPKLHAAMTDLLRAVLNDAAILLVEDTQWADAASSAYFASLASQLSSEPWMFLFTRRPDDDPPFERVPASKVMTVTPLPLEAARALARAAAPRMLLPSEAGRLAELAGGHPLFVQELARVRITDDEALPENVDGMVASRIDRLGPTARDRLRAVSVLGVSFDVDLIEPVTGDAGVRDLTEFLDVDGGTARFRQALFQQAAYNGLPFRRRQSLHRAAANVIAARGAAAQHAEELSLHFFEAAELEPAWEFSLAAGERARARYAFADSVTFYRRALASARRIPGLADVDVAVAWKDLGRSLFDAGDRGEAVHAYRRARRKASTDPVLTTRLLLNEAEAELHIGRAQPAARLVRRALAVADANPHVDQQVRSRAYLTMSQLLLRRGDADALSWAKRAGEVAADAGLTQDVAHAHALIGAVTLLSDPPTSEASLSTALRLYESIDDRDGLRGVLNNLGLLSHYSGDWALAASYYERSREANLAAGSETGAAHAAMNLAELLTDQGLLERAAELLEEVVSIFEQRPTFELWYATRNLGVVRGLQGDVAVAHALLDDAGPHLGEFGGPTERAITDTRRALMCLLTRDAEHAFIALAEAIAADPESEPARVAWLRAVAITQQSGRARGLDALIEAREIAEQTAAPFERALIEHTLARLGDSRYSASADRVFARLGVVNPPEIPLELSS